MLGNSKPYLTYSDNFKRPITEVGLLHLARLIARILFNFNDQPITYNSQSHLFPQGYFFRPWVAACQPKYFQRGCANCVKFELSAFRGFFMQLIFFRIPLAAPLIHDICISRKTRSDSLGLSKSPQCFVLWQLCEINPISIKLHWSALFVLNGLINKVTLFNSLVKCAQG